MPTIIRPTTRMIQYGGGPQVRYAQAASGVAAPLWTNTGAAYWSEWLAYLDYIRSENTGLSPTWAYGGGNNSIGAVYAPDGYVYYIPHDATSVKRQDPDTGAATTSGSLIGADKWWGASVGHTGNIYAAPYRRNKVLKIDTGTFTCTEIGPTLADDYRYCGMVTAPTGIVYGMPLNRSGAILRIDPSTDTVTEISGPPGTLKFNGGVLASNGYIYGVPYSAAGALKLNPGTDTYALVGTIPAGSGKWIGGVCGPDGNVYFIPYNYGKFGKMDVSTDTYSDGPAVVGRYRGGFIGPDGLIYAIPYDGGTSLAQYDPDAGTVNYVSIGQNLMNGGCLAPNGKAHFAGYTASTPVVVDFGASVDENFALSGHFNKY